VVQVHQQIFRKQVRHQGLGIVDRFDRHRSPLGRWPRRWRPGQQPPKPCLELKTPHGPMVKHAYLTHVALLDQLQHLQHEMLNLGVRRDGPATAAARPVRAAGRQRRATARPGCPSR
jgi:hypothetical protein